MFGWFWASTEFQAEGVVPVPELGNVSRPPNRRLFPCPFPCPFPCVFPCVFRALSFFPYFFRPFHTFFPVQASSESFLSCFAHCRNLESDACGRPTGMLDALQPHHKCDPNAINAQQGINAQQEINAVQMDFRTRRIILRRSAAADPPEGVWLTPSPTAPLLPAARVARVSHLPRRFRAVVCMTAAPPESAEGPRRVSLASSTLAAEVLAPGKHHLLLGERFCSRVRVN